MSSPLICSKCEHNQATVIVTLTSFYSVGVCDICVEDFLENVAYVFTTSLID